MPPHDPNSKQPNYAEMIPGLEASVKQLSEIAEKDPSSANKLASSRRTDTLLHVRNLAKGQPKQRAQFAATAARNAVLSKAIAG